MSYTIKRSTHIALALIVIGILTNFSISTNVPHILSPFSLPLVIPLFLGLPILAIVFISIFIFVLFNSTILYKISFDKIPMRLQALVGVTCILSIIWFVLGWEYGLTYQGTQYTRGIALLNFSIACILVLFCYFVRKRPTWIQVITIATLAHIWFFSYAFPYLGELL
ncbi:hypothetical protein KJ652_02060 [Patescibacteria group bacterium]|nr:hypothetical protein [Patescibacteria group bacterium]